ncbi:MAG: PAS domain S-box protein [Archangium sp.]|nr:PAS domain S-box protein [Archangium sp.]
MPWKTFELANNHDLVEACPAAVAIFDLEMNYLAVSRRFIHDYGLTEDPVGRNHYEVFPELTEAIRAVHRRALAGEVVRSECADPFRRANGKLDWVKWEVRPWKTQGGGIGGLILFTEVLTSNVATRAKDNAIFDQSSVGVVLSEAGTGCFLEVNECFARSLGYAPCELIGWSWMSITHPDDRARSGEVLAALLRGEPYHAEKRYICKDGSVWWGNVTVNPIVVDGVVREQVAFIVDINARKRAEAAERESETRFRTFFASSAVGMAQVDAKTGRFVDVNASYANLVGYERADLIGAEWIILSTPTELEADRARFAGLQTMPRAYTREKRQLRRDGSHVWAELTVTSLWEPGSPPTAYLIVAHDISQRKAAQQAVERNERRFRALLDRATDVLIELDGTGRVQFWSRAAEEQFGLTNAEVLARPFVSFLSEDDVEQATAALEEMRRTEGSVAKVRWHHPMREGGERLVEVTARNLLDDPDVGTVVLNLRDVTDENRLGLQLQQAQKLEGLGRLAGGVAHDFNNLLTVMLSCGRILAEDLPKGSSNAEDASQIVEAAERARGLTRQLLAFARKQVIAPTSLDLNEVVTSTRRMLQRLLGEDIELVAELDSQLGPVFADAGQLEQVLLNLAVNARDAMPRGGKLTISTRNVNDRWVKVVVGDTGVGMPPEVRSHLFEPFFTTKGEGKGTGLGLATVYGIVTQAGGQIRVESEVGVGTRFELDFPRSSLPPPATVAVDERSLTGNETLLVVEDELQVRNVLVRVLRGAGYRVLAADGAREALEIAARESSVDLVLSDVVMPEHDGRWLADELKRREVRVPVLFISGYTHDIIGEHGVLDGIELLPKPFTPVGLQQRVRSMLDRRKSTAIA